MKIDVRRDWGGRRCVLIWKKSVFAFLTERVLLIGKEISGVDECVVAGKEGRCGRGF